jgi:ribulose-phosphate 3-epimerase
MVEIIPAILAKTSEEFEQKFKLIEPYADRIHLDVCDGSFTSTSTIKGYEELIKFPSNKKWDVHLMVRFPENIMSEWYKTSADRFIFHIEVNHILQGLVEQAHLNGKTAGVAVNPETPMEAVEEIHELIDFVQFMSVKPGAQGSPFMEDVIGKITAFHESHPEKPIFADGGVNPDTGARLAIAGASSLVVGSYIFNNDDVAKSFDNLKVLNNFGN